MLPPPFWHRTDALYLGPTNISNLTATGIYEKWHDSPTSLCLSEWEVQAYYKCIVFLYRVINVSIQHINAIFFFLFHVPSPHLYTGQAVQLVTVT